MPLIPSGATVTRDELRRQSRDARRALIPDVRRAAAVAAAHLLAATPLYQDARRIAVYIAVDGELDPEPLVQNARAAGKEIYLPVLPPATAGVMSFRPYAPGAALKPNRFQIPEPVAGDPLPPADLDIVLTPLVAFDLEGNRLGMGAGYYDKTFAFLKRVQRVHPALVGFAYECQLAPEVPAEVWDVPLSAVVTEQHFYAVAHD